MKVTKQTKKTKRIIYLKIQGLNWETRKKILCSNGNTKPSFMGENVGYYQWNKYEKLTELKNKVFKICNDICVNTREKKGYIRKQLKIYCTWIDYRISKYVNELLCFVIRSKMKTLYRTCSNTVREVFGWNKSLLETIRLPLFLQKTNNTCAFNEELMKFSIKRK